MGEHLEQRDLNQDDKASKINSETIQKFPGIKGLYESEKENVQKHFDEISQLKSGETLQIEEGEYWEVVAFHNDNGDIKMQKSPGFGPYFMGEDHTIWVSLNTGSTFFKDGKNYRKVSLLKDGGLEWVYKVEGEKQLISATGQKAKNIGEVFLFGGDEARYIDIEGFDTDIEGKRRVDAFTEVLDYIRSNISDSNLEQAYTDYYTFSVGNDPHEISLDHKLHSSGEFLYELDEEVLTYSELLQKMSGFITK